MELQPKLASMGQGDKNDGEDHEMIAQMFFSAEVDLKFLGLISPWRSLYEPEVGSREKIESILLILSENI